MNYGINELDKEFDNTKKETETALLDASGIGGFGMTTGYLKMTADMFRLMKLDMVRMLYILSKLKAVKKTS